MGDKWKEDWSGWLKEGHFIEYVQENGIRYYERIFARDLAHWEYDWPETISSLGESGPTLIDELEITKGYDAKANTNHIWQVIFGIKSQVFIYIELPSDTHRHGLPKIPKPSADYRCVSHFTEAMSSFSEPTFLTEHFMMRPETPQITVEAYNPNAIDITDCRLNFFIAKMITHRVGHVELDGTPYPSRDKWKEVLDGLYKGVRPCRPITVLPVRAPAEAPAGH